MGSTIAQTLPVTEDELLIQSEQQHSTNTASLPQQQPQAADYTQFALVMLAIIALTIGVAKKA